MSVNAIYDTIAMLDAVKLIQPPAMHFLDTFFGETKAHTTRYVSVDVSKRGREAAAFVSPRHQARTVEHAGYSTKIFEPAYIKEKMVTEAGDLLDRAAGEKLLGVGTPLERATDMLAEELETLTERARRRWEIMAVQSLVEGKVDVVGDGINATVDFGRDADLTYQVSTLWGGGSPDAIADIDGACKLVKRKGGWNPDRVYFGSAAADKFMSLTSTKNALDTRRIDLGQIDPRKLDKGVTYLGTLKRSGVDLFEYDEVYNDGNGLVELLPEKKMLVIASQARRVMNFGVIQDLKGLFPVPLFPKSWEEEDPSARFLMLQSAPLPVPVEVDTTALVTVLA